MARADTRTLLSLDEWAKILGLHPLHFNGLASSQAPAVTCGSPMMQNGWQNADAVGREDVAIAISEAENRIAEYLGFRLKPDWIIDERHNWPGQRGIWALSPNFKADWGYMVAGGIEGKTAVALNAPIVYSDQDGDGYKESATISVGSSLDDPNEICLFYPGEEAASEWEIRPIKVRAFAGTLTITARREQFVIPDLQVRLNSNRAQDADDDANFLTSIDVYRIFHDPSQQINFLWEGGGGCGCSQLGCSTCFLSSQFGCTVVRDYRLGLIAGQPAVWNSATYNYEFQSAAINRTPDRVRLWYRAGWRKPGEPRWAHVMDAQYARAVAYLSATFLDRPICGCDNVEHITSYWKRDLARTAAAPGGAESFRLTTQQLGNPLGTTRGAISAWRLIRTQALGDAVQQ